VVYDLFHASHLPILQTDFDAMRVMRGFGKDIFDNASGQFAGALILFQDDQDSHAWLYLGAGLPGCCIHGSD
jgi:hypothetical protein